MNNSIFLYNFSKIFIPGIIILCIIFTGIGHEPIQNVPHSQKNIPKNSISPKTSRQNIIPPEQPKKAASTKPVTPKYNYLVEFTSGKSMKAEAFQRENNLVHIIMDDGYSMTLHINEIRSIKKFKL